MTKGHVGGTQAVAVNPREGTARVLADAVMSALHAGDMVAARASVKALEVFVEALGKARATSSARYWHSAEGTEH